MTSSGFRHVQHVRPNRGPHKKAASQKYKKKNSGCRNAIHSVRKTVERLTKGNNTVNICSLDFSKAFDKVNHYGLCIKLMKRLIPVVLLEVLENWLSGCFAFVKWHDSHSSVFNIRFGVRQGSVLSPYLFLIYIDDVGKLCDFRNGSFVLLYAGDMTPSGP